MMPIDIPIENKSPQDSMNSLPRPVCLICRSGGLTLYDGLGDRAFDAPGLWNLKKCSNSACGLLWLDPMPSVEDIWMAYRTYYTHPGHAGGQARQDPARRLFRRVIGMLKDSYLNLKYGYFGKQKRLLGFLLGWIGYLMPWRRSTWDMSVMFLPQIAGGKLLEIGCGGGDLLLGLKQLGWEVEGVDVDPVALENARMKGLRVNLGSLEQLQFADNSFDAVSMAHVIEHVHDPAQLLRECRRILKPNGRLSLVTPNAQSLGHRMFGRSWFALEPPRHLHIFTRPAMRNLLEESGFQAARVFTSIRDADGLFAASRSIRRSGRFAMGSAQPRAERIAGRIAQVGEWIALRINKSAGEELSVLAQK